MKRLIYIFIIFPLLFACGKQNDKLETALRLAGNNRPELEKVLSYYSQSPADSLKLRAARFLIENMPGHYTIVGGKVDSLRAKIDKDSTASYFLKKAIDIMLCHLNEMSYGVQKQEDIHHIKADFLIHHIDRSFEKRQQLPWLSDVPFELFLEHVLPYRFEHERIDYWIDSLQIDPESLAEAIAADNTKYALWNTNTYLPVIGDHFSAFHPLIKSVLRHNIHLECRDIASITALQSRVTGIPAASDFFPNYANRNGYHYWHSKISPEFVELDIVSALDRRSAKVYRETYSIQPYVSGIKGEYIPELFKNPFLKDVTDEYFHTANVQVVPIVKPNQVPHYAYLYTFGNMVWKPAVIGEYAANGIHFSNMAKNIVYLPGYYKMREETALHYPFVLRLDGGVDYLKPDTTNLLTVRLERKYPLNKSTLQLGTPLRAASVYAFNKRPTEPSHPLIPRMVLRKSYLEGVVDTNQTYRYWRINIPLKTSCAEVIFFDSKGNEIRGKINEGFERMYDKDPLTNQPATLNVDAYALIDFGRPVAVSRVVLLPRSDGNGIYPGDEYELFYHDLDGWQSLGQRVATDYFLDYDNLPAGALYWLHNHTRGVEERPFTITPSGDIRFW